VAHLACADVASSSSLDGIRQHQLWVR
jgi:hypothetical protein